MRFPTSGVPFRTQAFGSLVFMAKYLAQGTANAGNLGVVASAVWPSANLAIYLPFELDQPMVVTEMWTYNGTAAVTGNWDIGLYDAGGTRLVSMGSTAQTGSTAAQIFNTPDTLLGRGRFYLALVASSGSTTVYKYSAGAANDYLLWGALQQATAFPLPATATFASNQTAFLPFCGFSAKMT